MSGDVLVSEKIVDNRRIVEERRADGISVETVYSRDNTVSTVKYTKPDGSYEVFSGDGFKTIEQTASGVYRVFKYKSEQVAKEIASDGTITTFHDNGAISSIEKPKISYISFYDNGNLCYQRDENYEVSKYKDGRIQYEVKDDKLTVNPDFFAYYKIGIKSKDEPNHWSENFTLTPKKKTLLCLGGDQTRDAREANGNINVFSAVLGLSQEQLDNMQLCACYRPNPYELGIGRHLRHYWNVNERRNEDYKREILRRFMPFMAKSKDGVFERYSAEELNENFRNILIQAHCYGANDLVIISDVFKESLHKLGYSKEETAKAMSQIVCVSNNSQREFADNLGFTIFHRYSVKDGQFEPEYDTKYSDDYPEFLAKHDTFNKQKGKQNAFVNLNNNEVLMVFDKVLNEGSEHNEAFWTTKKEKLTTVGKRQAEVMKNIGAYWYKNTTEISSAKDFICKAVAGTKTEAFVMRAFLYGKKLKTEQRNPLVNHSILKKVWNEFNDKSVKPKKIGIFRVLSDVYDK